MNKKLVITNDGSYSFFVPEINECYHSRHGSIVEAEHVFIKNGLLAKKNNNLTILEIGFGTGLNALLTAQKAKQHNIYVSYHAVELYPVVKKEYTQLNFAELIGVEKKDLILLHQSKWEHIDEINNNFELTKNNISVEKYETNTKFDIIYYDAFSPEKQPKLWNESIFKKMHHFLKEDGFLITYCAKGTVRRTLKAVGFDIISLDGPPGKRQITRANRK